MPKVVCPYCKDKAFVVKNGRRHNKNSVKQEYRCNRCGGDFTFDDGFLRMRKKKEDIVEAVSLYEKGLYLQKVMDHMWQHHGLKVSPEAIRQWVRKFSRKIKGFVSKLKPEIKGRVHADEVVLKVKGEKSTTGEPRTQRQGSGFQRLGPGSVSTRKEPKNCSGN